MSTLNSMFIGDDLDVYLYGADLYRGFQMRAHSKVQYTCV